MTDRELKALVRSLESQREMMMSLWRRSLRDEAMIRAICAIFIAFYAEKAGKTQKQVSAHLVAVQKRIYQKILEEIEKKDPGLAAELDKRNIEDIF
jgi:hypothetical protein